MNLKAQVNNAIKKDTLYYLIDTIKTPKLDRLFEIEHTKQFVFYTIDCPCYAVKRKPQFYYRFKGTSNHIASLIPVYIPPNIIKKISFVSMFKLVTLSCSEGTHLNDRYIIFFVEHLPNGRYLMREVKSNVPPVVDELH